MIGVRLILGMCFPWLTKATIHKIVLAYNDRYIWGFVGGLSDQQQLNEVLGNAQHSQMQTSQKTKKIFDETSFEGGVYGGANVCAWNRSVYSADSLGGPLIVPDCVHYC